MAQSAKQVFSDSLRHAGYSVTKPRQTVFEVFLLHRRPLSMKELTKAIGSEIDRASVYRTVRLFEQLHIIRRVIMGWKYKLELSENFLSHHHHMHCEVCGKVIDIIEPPELEQYIADQAKRHNFTVLSHTFEIEGICKDCLNQRKQDRG